MSISIPTQTYRSLGPRYAKGVWEGSLSPILLPGASKGRPLSVNEMKDAMVRLYDESNLQHLSVFDEMFATDFISFGGAGFRDLHGAGEFRELYQQFLSAIPDLTFRVEILVAEDNLVGVRGTLGGHHRGNFMGYAPPTGKLLSWTGTAIFQFNNQGLMDARWQEWDGLSVMQQMGVMPAQPGAGGDPPTPKPPFVVNGVDGPFTSPIENKTLVRYFIDEVWNKGNLAVADEIFHPQATSPSAPQLPTGGEGVKVLARMFRQAMPDYHIEIIDLLADGDYVLARFTQSGTQSGELMGIPPTGKKATWGEIGILRFAAGKIVESWYNVDMLGLMQQLGVGGASAGA
jgi:predicted ester cyclase